MAGDIETRVSSSGIVGGTLFAAKNKRSVTSSLSIFENADRKKEGLGWEER
jgi:hypothetical protein